MDDRVRSKSRGLRVSALCLLTLLAACAVFTAPPKPAPDGGTPPAAGAPSEIEADVIRLTNEARARNGLAPLRASGQLIQASRLQVVQMVEHSMFSHTVPRGRYPELEDRLKAASYPYLLAAENIGWNSPTPEAVVAGWMNSAGHRTNILNAQFTEMGAAMARNQRGEPYWVQVFGKPR
jgi:uncharacterized protein YkwD